MDGLLRHLGGAGRVRHPQPAAADRHRRDLRLPARAPAGLPHRGQRPRRRRGVPVRGARQPGRVFNVHLTPCPRPGRERRPACTARRRRPRDRPRRLRHQGAARRPAGGRECHQEGDAAFLFSSDEEANDPRCIAAFSPVSTASPRRSSPSPPAARRCWRIAASARCCCAKARPVTHPAPTRWPRMRCTRRCAGAAIALDLVEAEAKTRFGGLTGLRFHIGKVEGTGSRPT